jgi:hypothetical protein
VAGAGRVAPRAACPAALDWFLLLLPAAALTLGPGQAGAQPPTAGGQRVKGVARVDALVGRRSAVQLGAGVTAALGTYVRVDAVAAAGPAFYDGGARLSSRVDATARFVLDPFRQLRRGLYAGGGLSARRVAGKTTGQVVALVGVEGALHRAYTPAVEVGLGGGLRLGVVIRQGRPGVR